MLSRRILQLDCAHDCQSRIYVELTDQYREMDAISDVVKWNVVAQRLKEVIDVLEKTCMEIDRFFGSYGRPGRWTPDWPANVGKTSERIAF